MFSPADFDIIDMHTHPFLSAENRFGRFWHTETLEDFLAVMAKYNIGKFAGSFIARSEPGEDFSAIVKLNEMALRLRDRCPEKYIPGIQLHGGYPQESCRMLHEMYAQGVRLVGELVPYMLNTGAYTSSGMMEIFREAEKLGLPVDLHCGTTEELTTLAATFPELKIITAHPGDGADLVEKIDTVAGFDNLYLDLSGTGLFRWGMLEHAVKRCGAEKLLFGSDMPICNPVMNLYAVLSENISRKAMSLILGGNFRRLAGI